MQRISTPFYKILDLTLIFTACSLSYWVRFDTPFLPLYYFLPTAIFAIVSTFSLSITNFYQETNSNLSSGMAFSALAGLLISSVSTIVCLYLTKTGEDYSRIWLISSGIFSFISLLLLRFILKRIFHISTNPRVIVLVGNESNADIVKKNITRQATDEIVIAKHFELCDQNDTHHAKSLFNIAEFIEDYRISKVSNSISEIWVTQDVFQQFDHIDLTAAFIDSSITLVYIPSLPDFFENVSESQIKVISGVPTVNSGFSKNQKLKEFLKFIEDQIIAWLALILLSPLLIIISVFVKLDSSGPVIFKQNRYGLSGNSFQIWKFRTMLVDNAEQVFKQATKDDPRVTRVGKILRKTSLDELPQLLNVISGKMSIVGPRPHPTMLNEQYRFEIYKYMLRHKVKPGITGLAQIRGYRGETKDPKLMKMRIKSDLEYVENWSIWLDIKILLKTVLHLLNTDKAY